MQFLTLKWKVWTDFYANNYNFLFVLQQTISRQFQINWPLILQLGFKIPKSPCKPKTGNQQTETNKLHLIAFSTFTFQRKLEGKTMHNFSCVSNQYLLSEAGYYLQLLQTLWVIEWKNSFCNRKINWAKRE